MSGFEVKPNRFRKVHGEVALEAAIDRRQVVEAIVKVNVPGYVPPGVKIRARIDDQMLTVEVATDLLPDLEHDPKVDTVSVGRRLRVID